MDFSEEELKKLVQEKEVKDNLAIEKDKRRVEIRKLFESGKLENLKPIWHVQPANIDLSLQREKIDDKLLLNGFSIILEVDFELLLNLLKGGNSELFRQKMMFNDELNDYRISDILDYWSNGEALIPPTILDNDFVNKDSHFLFPTDGKHRMNVSYYYGVKSIPILVLNDQLDKIKKILENGYGSISSK